MLTESLVEAFRTRLATLGFDLADLRIGGTPNRPLVQVRIDWPLSTPAGAAGAGAGEWDGEGGEPARGVTVQDCTAASRALEAWLDASGLLGTRYVLEVSSPGFERPVRWHRHWARFVGRDVNVKLAGLGRVRARIVAVPDAETVILEPRGGAPVSYRLADVRDARLAVDW